ncbi:MAG: L-threonylcarbamoyladenylate synthase [Polyangiaceae bacterium]
METRRLLFSDAAIREAAAALVAGGLVAFPTETVYGLGARADRGEAVRRIFAAKGRPSGNPLIVHVADRDGARALSAEWPAIADALAEAFWPGPLTLVVRRAEGAVADEVTAGGPTVAVRVPAHPAALALLREARVPVAAPSANRSTTISPTTADHVQKTLDGAIEVVLDAGPTGFGIESTIVDVTRSPMRLLRHGAVPLAALARFGEVIDVTARAVDASERADAPGMHAKHYAPRARAELADPADVAVIASRLIARGERVGAIVTEGAATIVRADGRAICEVLPADPEGYARGLYAALHRLDDAGCDAIVIARVDASDAWAAVRDRLRRATAE